MRGIRKASDFLMALQLTGAAKVDSLANLQVRLPAGVIGGGLTAMDTATELMAYYPVQVQKILHRYETLVDVYGEQAVRGRYDTEEIMILDEFLAHGRAIDAERQRAEPQMSCRISSLGEILGRRHAVLSERHQGCACVSAKP